MCGIDEYCVIATLGTIIISNHQGIQCDGMCLIIIIKKVMNYLKKTPTSYNFLNLVFLNFVTNLDLYPVKNGLVSRI